MSTPRHVTAALVAGLVVGCGDGAPDSDDVPFAAQRAACTFAAGSLAANTFGPSLVATPIPIDTFVIVMQENRSFDHYFSALPAAGQPDVDVAAPTATIHDANGQPVSRFHQTDYCFADTLHTWNEMHADWNGGANDGFAAVNATADDPSGVRALGYFDAADLPFAYGLATTFATSDRYFSPTLTSTGPNRLYLYAATSAGLTTNVGATPFETTIFAALAAAGASVAVYTNNTADPPFAYETLYPELGTPRPWSEYVAAAAANTLPNLVFLYVGGDTESDEHPPSDMQAGQVGVAAAYAVLATSPQWGRSAFIVTYDESGGLYDHVPPPPACAPDAIPPDLGPGDRPGDFARYGFRVPILVASAWSKPHYVSHVIDDHTSITRLIELRFGLGALSARDANANALLDVFDFSHQSFPTAPALPPATVDAGHCSLF